MTAPNVRRISGSHNPDDRSYTGLGYVDKDGTYHFPDGRILPATGGITTAEGEHHLGSTALVVREDATPCTIPTPDGANPIWSGLERLHCVDQKRQDTYDLAEFGEVGGDPVAEPVGLDPILPARNAGSADPHSPTVKAYEVGSPERNEAIETSRREHPERHTGISPYTEPGSSYNHLTPIENR